MQAFSVVMINLIIEKLEEKGIIDTADQRKMYLDAIDLIKTDENADEDQKDIVLLRHLIRELDAASE